MSSRRIEYLSIAELRENPANPKLHTADIGTSIERFGYVEPVIVDERTGLLVAGHGRKEALLELETKAREAKARGERVELPDGIRVKGGNWLVPVVRGWSSANDAEASAMLVASNRLVEQGGWDDPSLAVLLDELAKGPGLDGVGFTSSEVDALLIAVAAHDRSPAGERDPDEHVEPPREPRTRKGDVWLLGPHRLLCGDCRDPDDVARALAGATVNVAITSPPYADRRDYDEASGFRPIHPDEYVEWFAPVAANVAAHLAPDGSWFVNIKAASDGLDQELYVLDLVAAHARDWGWHFATEFCWERNGTPGTPARRFKNQFEPVYQFARAEWKFRPNAVRHYSENVPIYDPGNNVITERRQGEVGYKWFGARARRPNSSTASMKDMQGVGADVAGSITAGLAYPGNRLPTFAGSHEATGHTAAFPIGLPAFFIAAYSDEGDIVYDPFAGSGSTLLAAHDAARIGIGVELSAGYCDVTCRRFQRLTDAKPILERTGEPVDFS